MDRILVTFRNKILGVHVALPPSLWAPRPPRRRKAQIKELCEALVEMKEFDALFLQKKEAIEQ